MTTPSTDTARVLAPPRATVAAVTAMLLGLFVIYGVAFAGPAVLHNAAHDTRHSFAFPCH